MLSIATTIPSVSFRHFAVTILNFTDFISDFDGIARYELIAYWLFYILSGQGEELAGCYDSNGRTAKY
jgi:hypothetical protein